MSAWPLHALSSLGTVITGTTPKTSEEHYYGGEIPFITPAELDQSNPIKSAPRTLSDAGAKEVRLLSEHSVLVCCIGSLGKVGIAGCTIATNQQINSVVFDTTKIIPRYGFYACRLLKRKLTSMAPATTVPIVSKSKFEQLEIPVPPLSEQRRIAAILDKADELRAKRRAALAKLDSLTQSIFLDMFGDPATNPKGWPEVAFLGEVAEIVSGITKGRQLNGKATRVVPYLAVINVQDRALNLATPKTIEATEEEIERYRLQKGDLLLTEGGDPDKLGRGTLWDNELPECIHQNHVFRVRLTSDAVEPIFLEWLIGSTRGKRYFLRSAKQTTGIATINMTQLRNFPLLLPPVELQQEFAMRLAKTDLVGAAQHDSVAKLNDAFASLQHRAFQGEL